jgi:regulator of sigma D
MGRDYVMPSTHRLRTRVLALACGILLAHTALAFRSTNTESFTDPDYKDFRPKKVVVMVLDASNETRSVIEDRLIDKLADYGVVAIKERALFPPTRVWTPEARAAILKANSVDSSLIVAAGSSSASIMNVGTQTYATTNVSGTVNTTGNQSNVYGTATTNATSYNLTAAHSVADFSAVLVDVSNGRTAWYADITTKAHGMAFVSGKGDAKGAAKGVIEGLANDGHVSKK